MITSYTRWNTIGMCSFQEQVQNSSAKVVITGMETCDQLGIAIDEAMYHYAPVNETFFT